MDKYEKLRAKLEPASIKRNLTLASLYLCAYETLITTITDCVENTEFIKFDKTGWIFSKNYRPQELKEIEEYSGIKIKGQGNRDDIIENIKKEIEKKHKKRYEEYKKASKRRTPLKKEVYISSLWLVEEGIINEDEIEIIQKITDHRNEIAHKLPTFLIDLDLEIKPDYLKRIIELFSKIDQWYTELERSIEPDLELRRSERYSFTSILLGEIFSAAISD